MKTKRLFAALLAALMTVTMLSGLTLPSLALNGPNDIKSVALTLAAPTAGATVDRSNSSVTCDAPMDYKVVGVHWYKGNETDYLYDRLGEGSNDKYFIGNYTYTVKIELAVKGDRTWNFEYVHGEPVYHIDATVNGKPAVVGAHELNPNAKTICVTYVFENIPVGEFIPYVSLGTPVAGKTKSDVILAPYNERQMRLADWGEDCNWFAYKNGAWTAMESGEAFVAGKDYRLIATFYANEGFRFSASGTHTVGESGYVYGYVNGRQMSMKLDKYAGEFLYNRVTFTYDFVSCKAQELDSVSFGGIQAPVTGQHPQYTVTMGDATYSLVTDDAVSGGAQYGFVNGIAWSTVGGTPLTAASVFEQGSSYALSFFIKSNAIHRFADWVAGEANVGYVSVEPLFDDPTLAFVTVEFAPCGGGVMTDINVGGVTEPVNGAKPDYDFTYGQGYDKGDADPSIVWFDLTANKELSAEDTFEYGHTYELLIIVRSDKAIKGDAGEFEFAPIGTLKAKINGEDVGAIMARPTYPETHYVQLAMTFECAKAPVTEVSLQVENPLEGKSPAQQIFPKDTTYGVVSFQINDFESDKTLDADSVYVGARSYGFTVLLSAKEGYQFAGNTVVALINNQTANVIYADEDQIVVSIILMAEELPSYSISFTDENGASVAGGFLAKAGVIELPEYELVVPQGYKFVGWTLDGGQTVLYGKCYINSDTEFVAVLVEEGVHKHIYDDTYTDNGQGFHEKSCIDENCPDSVSSVISEMHQYGNSTPCDLVCTICGFERTSDTGFGYHNYEHACSEVCPTCGMKRETTHTPGAAANCTDSQTCTVCAKVLEKAKGHTPGEAASCAHAQVCTTCQTVLVPAPEHTAGVEWLSDESAHWHGCAVCGGEVERAEHADAGGDELCDTCGADLSEGMPVGAIIAIVIGGVALLGCVGFFLYRAKTAKKRPSPNGGAPKAEPEEKAEADDKPEEKTEE